MGEKRDLYNYPRKIELALARVKNNPDILSKNKKAIADFYQWSNRRGLSPAQCLKNIDYSITLARKEKTPFVKMKKADVGRLLDRIENGNYAKWTQNTFRSVLKQLFRFIRGSGDEDPPEVAWFHIGKTHYSNQSSEETLNDADVARILAELPTPTDRAIVLTLYNSAARITEAMSLKIGDIKEDENGWLLINLTNFKTNQKIRTVPVPDTGVVRQLKEFNRQNPQNADPKAPFFYSTYRASIDYSAFRSRLDKAGERAKIGKPVNPHAFRHARLTAWAAMGMGDQQLKYLAGWTQNSDMAAVYIHSDFDMVKREFTKRFATKGTKDQQQAALWDVFQILVKYVNSPEEKISFLKYLENKKSESAAIENARNILIRLGK